MLDLPTILTYFGYAFLAVEGAFTLYSLQELVRVIRAYRAKSQVRADFLLNLRESLAEILFKGRVNTIVGIISHEIAMLRYAFAWWSNIEQKPHQTSFSTYKTSGYSMILSILLSVGVIEMIGAHFLLTILWNSTAALIVTVFSLYGALFLVSDMIAMRKRPTLTDDQGILFRIGIRWTGKLDFAAIERVEFFHGSALSFESRLDTRAVANAVSMGKGNIRITLKKPTEFLKSYGLRTSAQILVCTIDEPQRFIEIVESGIAQYNTEAVMETA